MKSRQFLTILLVFCFVSCGKLVDELTGKEEQQLSTQKSVNLEIFHKTIQNLEVKVFYEPGAEPYAGKLLSGEDVWSFLQKNLTTLYSNKLPQLSYSIPKNLNQMTPLPSQNKTTWDSQSLLALKAQVNYGNSTPTKGEFAIFFLNGYFEGNSGIIGIHLGGTTVIGIFKDVIKNMTVNDGQQVKNFTEQITVIHEMGHALGLVNLGVPLQSSHHSADHPGHCSRTDCVMYWANQGKTGLMQFVRDYILSGRTSVFGDQCLNDFQSY